MLPSETIFFIYAQEKTSQKLKKIYSQREGTDSPENFEFERTRRTY